MKSTFVMIQMESVFDPQQNAAKARALAKTAVEQYHPDVLIFPETFMSAFPAGTSIAERNAVAEPLDGPFCGQMKQLAGELGLWIVFGMKEKSETPGDPRVYNTIVLVNSEGRLVSTYRKTHLYDAFGYRESDEYIPGDHLFEPIDTPFGRIGLFVCYEVRFPEVARFAATRGADILLMPTAWYRGEGKSHQFRTLVTARALENTAYLLACDQCGGPALGESLAVDPMGNILVQAGASEAILPVTVDTAWVERVREILPSCEKRHPELY